MTAHRLGTICILAANALALIVCGHWLFIDSVTLEVRDPQWYGWNKVERRVFRAGEVANLRREFCVSRTVNVHTERRFSSLDGRSSVSVASSAGALTQGCEYFTYALMIPVGFATGDANYRAMLRVEINPLKTMTFVIDAPPIEVTE